MVDPQHDLSRLVWFAVLVAFASATQDIVIDAFRIESGGARLQAAMAATYMIGYRLAMIMAGAGVLWLAAPRRPTLALRYLETAAHHRSSWEVGELEERLKDDRSRVRVSQISEFGLVEVTRKRSRSNLRRVLTRPCPCCGASGRVKVANVRFD